MTAANHSSSSSFSTKPPCVKPVCIWRREEEEREEGAKGFLNHFRGKRGKVFPLLLVEEARRIAFQIFSRTTERSWLVFFSFDQKKKIIVY